MISCRILLATGEMTMAEIKISEGTKVTKEVREAIDKKLKELEDQAVKEGTNVKISHSAALWSVNYKT